MTTYNTGSDAANTAVRAFLTKVGEHYLGRTFDTSSGKGKQDWERIRENVFENKCAYCENGNTKLQIEHLIMFNREEFGLHHPGNVVPVCKSCNKRKKQDGKYVAWEEQLKLICNGTQSKALFSKRRNKILGHIKDECYPVLSKEESHSIRVVAEGLYEHIKNQVGDSLKLYKDLDQAFVKNNSKQKQL